jgi:uncharacterized surface anchored protein
VDPSEAIVAAAQVRLTHEDQSPSEELLSDADGRFTFTDVAPGSFQLTVTSAGFTTRAFSGTLRPGEAYIVP